MSAIYKNELRVYFLSPIGYVFIGAFILLNSIFFLNGPVAYASADVKYIFSNTNMIFMFLIAILTMRLLAEERGRKTDQLLLTAPVRAVDIVMGKYFAAFSVFMIALAISAVYIVVLFAFGEPSISECIGGYIGFILLWAALISIGVFVSSLTENQVVSAVVSFIVLLFVSFMDSIAAGISDKTASAVINALSPMHYYVSFQSGVIDAVSVVYFLSLIFVMLFLSVQSIEKRRYL